VHNCGFTLIAKCGHLHIIIANCFHEDLSTRPVHMRVPSSHMYCNVYKTVARSNTTSDYIGCM